MKNYKIILASNSPRRKELLQHIVPQFEIRTKAIDEIYPKDLAVEKVAEYLAQLKAKAFVADIKPNELIITADTTVIAHKTLYGKPKNREEAIEILQQLSGKRHQVITGVCLLSAKKQKTFSCTTTVTFKKLSLEEIVFYVDKFKPYDKAGAYAIQEWIGFIGIKKIKGDYNNIVGLPLQKLYAKLHRF